MEIPDKSTGKQSKRNAIDWEGIEREYRAGIRSTRDIGAEYGCSHTLIQRRINAEGWEKDLSAKIRAKADAKVAKDAVSKIVTMETKATEREIVEANAELQAKIIREHRTDIIRYRKLCQAMLSQLESETGEPELFNQIGELLAAPDEKGTDKINDAYRKAISLPQRIDGVKKLAETLKTLIGLERQAFGIADNADGDKPPQKDETNIAPREIARRIAFALSIGLKDAQTTP